MTSKLTPAQLDEIEATAKKATPGKWFTMTSVGDASIYVAGATGFGDNGFICGEAMDTRDAEYIATANPEMLLALVAEVRELRVSISSAQGIIGPRESLDPDQGGCEGACDEILLNILDALDGAATGNHVAAQLDRIRQIVDEKPDAERCKDADAGESCSGCLAARMRSVLDGTCYPPIGEEA